MSWVNVPIAAMPNLPFRRWARNGLYPGAYLAHQLADQTNHVIACLGKELFRKSTGFAAPTSNGARDRWRVAFHSSPYAKQLWVKFECAPPDKGGNSGVNFQLKNGAGTVLGNASYQCGSFVSGSSNLPSWYQSALVPVTDATGAIVTIPADTDLFGLFQDVDQGRLAAAMVYEDPLDIDTVNGYIDAGVGVLSPIYDNFRQGVATVLRNTYKTGSAHLVNLAVDLDTAPQTTNSATATNLIDTSATGAPTVASPGWTLDLTNDARLRTGAVTVAMRVYGKNTVSGGTVNITDSAGVTHGGVTGFGVTAAWSAVSTFTLPATSDKFDPQFSTVLGTLSVWAVCLYLLDS